jgi:hypothetical protein
MSRRNKPQKLNADQVLRYSPQPASRSTVRRHYAAWREERGIPPRCDLEGCVFNLAPLTWSGKPLPLILDHANGNNRDNNPNNLRYLCPNCDSQLDTRGGANRGRVLEASDGKYVLITRDSRRHLHLIPEPGGLRITGYAPTVTIAPAVPSE